MLSPELDQTLRRALAHATKRGQECAALEHLLLALTEDQDAIAELNVRDVDLDRLRHELSSYLDDQPKVKSSAEVSAKPTVAFQQVVQRAAVRVQCGGRDVVTGANVLEALFSQRMNFVPDDEEPEECTLEKE